jgi:hypothetical protein
LEGNDTSSLKVKFHHSSKEAGEGHAGIKLGLSLWRRNAD